ncbi:MAG: acetolactate synthase large subunit, partial [Actinobacteria bacterium]|nr:acetolactate synthase large subunit [Actinomycetota bacterium]
YSATCVACQPDFVKLAEAYGVEGYLVSECAEVEDVLRVALASDAPAVIDFRVKREANVWPMVPAGGSIDQMLLEGTS